MPAPELHLVEDEPVMLSEIARVGLLLAVSFGLNLSSEQVGLLVTFVSLLIAVWTRSRVSPVIR